MSERKINLERILNKHLANKIILEVDWDDMSLIKNAMKEACRQTLELATENATYNRSVLENLNYVQIDKQSILNTINQIE